MIAWGKPLRHSHNLFFGPALRLGETGDAAHVTTLNCVWADVDGKCFSDGKDGALRAIDSLPLKPQIIVDSGHGFQPYWLLREPIDVAADGKRTVAVMRGLRKALSASADRTLDSVHDLSRVLRLPGTRNFKDATPLVASVFRFEPSATRPDLVDFEDLGLTDDGASVDIAASAGWDSFEGDTEAALRGTLSRGFPPWALGALEEPDAHIRSSASELDFAVLRELIARGASPGEAEAIWAKSALGARSKVQHRADYRALTLGRALAANRKDPSAHSSSYADGRTNELAIRVHTASEIAESTPDQPPWVIEPYVAEGSATLLTGKPKLAGKTTLLMHAIGQVLGGAEFLGWQCAKTPVVYLTEERPATFRAVLKRADLLDRDDLFIVFWHEARDLKWAELVRLAADKCLELGSKLLVVDTVAQFAGLRGEDENSAGAMLAAVQPLQEAAGRGIAVVAVAHDRKAGGEVADSTRGNGAFAGAVDVVMSIRRPGGNAKPTIREIHAVGRFDQTPDRLVVELQNGEYGVVGEPSLLDPSKVEPGIDDAILQFVPGDESIAVAAGDLELLVVTNTRFRRTAIRASLKQLVTKGKIGQSGKGVRGNPFRYWRVDGALKIDSLRPRPPARTPDESKCAGCGAILGPTFGCACPPLTGVPEDALLAGAEELIRTAEAGMPAFVGTGMETIALAFGITGLDKKTPTDIIAELREKMEAST